MVIKFLGTCPTFNPPHMWDLMDDVDMNYKLFGLTPNDSINLNEDSIDANYEAIQNVNVEEDTNVDDDWMFKPTLATILPPHSAATKSFTKLMHEISGNSTHPIHIEVTSPLLPLQMQLHHCPFNHKSCQVLTLHQTPPHQH